MNLRKGPSRLPAFNAQHIFECVFVAVGHLQVAPGLQDNRQNKGRQTYQYTRTSVDIYIDIDIQMSVYIKYIHIDTLADAHVCIYCVLRYWPK